MKQLLFLFASFLFLSSSCRKHKNINPIDQLPPETQTGANTFGCLVNGQVFKPGGAQLSGGSLQCNYQFLGSGAGGGYYFRIIGINDNSSNRQTVGIFTDSLEITEGASYDLKEAFIKPSAYGLYSFSTTQLPTRADYETTDMYTGVLTIKKLDIVNQIVSGTFWFNGINSNGDTVRVSDGRFDVRYTQ